MSFPFGNYFGNIVEDENADPNAIYLFNPKYKMVNVNESKGEPPAFKEEIDWDATAKASAMIWELCL